MTYYTAQLFCKISDNPEAWQNVTRKVNQITIQGCKQESWLTQLTQDIRNNRDTTYSVNAFPSAKAFDGDKIDATKNRHILRVMFQGIPLIAELVKYFEEKYTHLEVRSVWMIDKSKENDSFQGWHRDFYLGTEVTTTIVVNIGAVTKNGTHCAEEWAHRNRRHCVRAVQGTEKEGRGASVSEDDRR